MLVAVTIALLATVLFVLVQKAACKCHCPAPSVRAGKARAPHKDMVPPTDPTYMEVDLGGGRNDAYTLENDAYTSTQ